MQNRNFVAENLMQVGGDRWCKSNFRNQKDGRAASVKHRTHSRQVNGSLAGTSYTVKKDAGEFSRLNRFS